MEELAGLTDIPDPGVLPVRLADGRAVCLVRVGDRVTAFLDECSHNGMPLSAGEVHRDCELECAWHGARFDCLTGRVLQGPAEEALVPVEVRVVAGKVVRDGDGSRAGRD